MGIALFRILTRAEVEQLARLARTITLGPTARILVQGNPGSSLFVRERPAILDELTQLMTSRTEVADAALTPAGLLERLAAAIFGA